MPTTQGYVGFDDTQPPGQRFKSPAVRAEVEELATGDPGPGGVTTSRIAERAVTRTKIAEGAVGTDEIGSKQVKTGNLDDDAVGTAQIAADAVGPTEAGTGVVTSFDKDGNAVEIKLVKMTAAQYTALVTKEPGTYYFLSA